jgi:hypothetical protein
MLSFFGDVVLMAVRIADCHRERFNGRLQLLTDVCDLVLPTSALGWISANDGVVGLAGTLSSLIGAYMHWAKTA